MNYSNIWSLSFLFIAATYLSNAYGVKKNADRRKQTLSKVTVNKDKSVKAARRTYKSVDGYLEFVFYDSIAAGILCMAIAIPSYILSSPAFDFIGTAAAIAIYLGANFFFYSKFKNK